MRRNKYAIIADILGNVEKVSKVTEIMHDARLSFRQWVTYRDFLLKKELMTEKNNSNDKKLYVISEKGRKFRKGYEEIKGYLA